MVGRKSKAKTAHKKSFQLWLWAGRQTVPGRNWDVRQNRQTRHHQYPKCFEKLAGFWVLPPIPISNFDDLRIPLPVLKYQFIQIFSSRGLTQTWGLLFDTEKDTKIVEQPMWTRVFNTKSYIHMRNRSDTKSKIRWLI